MTLVYTNCVNINCNAGIVEFEPNNCIRCGKPLCEHCYDASSYCKDCQKDEQPTRSGECVECGRTVTRLSDNGYCEGCVMQAMIEQERI